MKQKELNEQELKEILELAKEAEDKAKKMNELLGFTVLNISIVTKIQRLKAYKSIALYK
ncbi:hypothetical protein [Chroococcus sp. FPU101]|uniref:hypothetical protein n=1 Tax=Chroococcus sp. FPU101 TaxID=1974212 RepID=UPI001A8CEB4F|nr:hypothetical protein [Chroococcus sp. FPU101]